DYLIPVATDYPNVTTISLEEYPSPNNPLGAKGAGEGGIIPIGGSVANAVASALKSLGIEPCELPLTPARVWQMIAQAQPLRCRPPERRGPRPPEEPSLPKIRPAPTPRLWGPRLRGDDSRQPPVLHRPQRRHQPQRVVALNHLELGLGEHAGPLQPGDVLLGG